MFLGRSKLAAPETVREAPPAMLIAMGLLCVPVILLGWQPGLLLEGLVAPGLAAAGVPVDGVAHYLGHNFLAAGDIAMSLLVFALGGMIFFVGMKFGLFHLRVPSWLSAEAGFRLAGRAMMAVIGQGATGRPAGRERAGALSLAVLRGISLGYERVRHRIAWSLRAARRRTLLGLGEAGHARRRLVESVLVGLPGSAGAPAG